MQVQAVLGSPWVWAKDPLMEGILEDACDFPIFDMSNPRTTVDKSLSFPYIARNMDLNWPAFRKWEKEAFVSHYGSNFVRSGSEASIVHSGGVAENETTLSAMINSMSQSKKQVYGDSFLFDTTILKAIPELTRDFDVPMIFQDWDTPENESSGALWHMLSLGPSRSGEFGTRFQRRFYISEKLLSLLPCDSQVCLSTDMARPGSPWCMASSNGLSILLASTHLKALTKALIPCTPCRSG